MFIVDAFTSHVFNGNPAAVLVLQEQLDDALMQQIAAENGLSETAFVRRLPTEWSLRWFAPRQEVELCGHATLAAAHVLRTAYGVTNGVAFSTASGRLDVFRHGEGYRMMLPRLDPVPVTGPLPPALARAADIADDVFANRENYFVVLPGEDEVRAFRPDLADLASLHPYGLAVTARGSDGVDFVSRYFAPSFGISEDPVTGSTHVTLAPYWAARLRRRRLRAAQLSARGGAMTCELHREFVALIGSAATYLSGRIYVDAGR